MAAPSRFGGTEGQRMRECFDEGRAGEEAREWVCGGAAVVSVLGMNRNTWGLGAWTAWGGREVNRLRHES